MPRPSRKPKPAANGAAGSIRPRSAAPKSASSRSASHRPTRPQPASARSDAEDDPDEDDDDISLVCYENQLAADPKWALMEGSQHFEQKSAVFEALHRITKRLQRLTVPYAILGGMALFKHGLRRFTEHVDVLVTHEGLRQIHQELSGNGYLPQHPHSKHLRDAELGVRIEFVMTGEYPGGGHTGAVPFPDPHAVNIEWDDVSYINLASLIELKLASGMMHAGRLRDLSDVQDLIQTLHLSARFGLQLNSHVKDKYAELWQQSRSRFVSRWRIEGSAATVTTIDDLIALQPDAAHELDAMKQDGVVVDTPGAADAVPVDSILLVTTDPEVAARYDMVEESEFWDAADSGSD